MKKTIFILALWGCFYGRAMQSQKSFVNDLGIESIITTSPDYVTLIVYPIPQPDISGDNILCEGDTITLDAGSGYASYAWNTGDSTQVIEIFTGGTYSVTVENNHSCVGQDTFVVDESSNIEVLLQHQDETCHFQGDGSISGTIISGTPPFHVVLLDGSGNLVSASTTTQNFLFQNLFPGTYHIIVSNNYGCEQTYSVTIQSSSMADPNASFSVSQNCLISNNSVIFTNESTGNPTTYLWDFGDGTTSTDASPTHVFSNNGYHCVTLTVSNQCGESTYRDVLYINLTDCPCNNTGGVFDYNDGDMLVSDITGGDYSVDGNLIVPSGTHITLQGVIFRFTPRSRFIIEQGAKVDAYSCTFTSYCDSDMWQGIEVWGKTDEPSYDPNNSSDYNPNQGVLVLAKSSSVKNAHIGVLLGKRNMEMMCSGETNYENYYVFQNSGGVLFAANDKFVNNGIDIKFIRKQNNDGYKNVIEYSDFITKDSASLADPHYQTVNADAYPNIHNPWAGNITIKNNNWNPNGITCMAVDVNNVGNFTLLDNDYIKMVYGVNLLDARVTIKSSSNNNAHIFKNMRIGVYMANPINGIATHKILNYKFLDISQIAIEIIGAHNTFVYNNDVGSQQSQQYSQINDFGILSISSMGNRIGENNFYNNKYGILAWNDKSGFIGAMLPNWNGNLFYQNSIGIITAFDNHNLTIKCNEFRPNIYSNSDYYSNWYNLKLFNIIPNLANQGYPESQCINTRCPAGNRFYNAKEIISIDNDYYYYHHNHVGHPELVPVDPNHVVHIIENSNEYWQGNNQSCLPVIIPNPTSISQLPALSFDVPPYSSLDSLAAEELKYKNERDSVMTLLDNGNNTLMLLDELNNSGNSKMYLTGLLIQNSPLSDTVLITAISRSPAFSPMQFTLFMMYNIPYSSKVSPYYRDKYKGLPKYFKRILDYVEKHPIVKTPTYYHLMAKGTNRLKENLMQHLVMALEDSINNNRYNDAITLLEHVGGEDAYKQLITMYFAKGMYHKVLSVLDSLVSNSEENRDIRQLYGMLANVYLSGKSIYDMDSAEIESIRILAEQCNENMAVAAARGIYEKITGVKIMPCPFDIEENKKMVAESQNGNNSKEETLTMCYPIPAKDKLNIEYELPPNLNAKIQIFNIDGKMQELHRIKDTGILKVYVSSYTPGTYFYVVTINEIAFESAKFVVSH